MEVLILSHHDVRQLLPMKECIAVVAEAFKTLAAGDAVQPLRWPLKCGSKNISLYLHCYMIAATPAAAGKPLACNLQFYVRK